MIRGSHDASRRFTAIMLVLALVATTAPLGAAEPPALARAVEEAVDLATKYREEMNAYYRAAGEAEGGAAGEGAAKPEDPTPRFAAAAQERAIAYAGSDAAVPFLSLTILVTEDAAVRADAAERAIAAHVGSRALPSFVAALGFAGSDLGAERVRGYLDRIIAENAHAEVLAEALLARATQVLGPYPEPPFDKATPAQTEAALADLRRAHELAKPIASGDLVGRLPVAPAVSLVDRIDGLLFAAEKLRIGLVAPDIAGTDLDGVEFKLSDYRGKVVVVDFWGDW
jgi:hypothetical protein